MSSQRRSCQHQCRSNRSGGRGRGSCPCSPAASPPRSARRGPRPGTAPGRTGHGKAHPVPNIIGKRKGEQEYASERRAIGAIVCIQLHVISRPPPSRISASRLFSPLLTLLPLPSNGSKSPTPAGWTEHHQLESSHLGDQDVLVVLHRVEVVDRLAVESVQRPRRRRQPQLSRALLQHL